MKLLITHKADIKARNKYSCIPFHFAAENNSTETAQRLIAHQADIKTWVEDNRTLFHLATYKSKKEVVQLLIARKEDIIARYKYNNTPVEVVSNSCWRNKAVMPLLMKYAASTS